MSNDPAAPRPSPALADLFIPERTQEIGFWTALSMGYGRVVVNWHCGTGELALGLAKNQLRVVGVDPDLEAIEIARAREATTSAELLLTWLCHEPRLVSLPGKIVQTARFGSRCSCSLHRPARVTRHSSESSTSINAVDGVGAAPGGQRHGSS